MPDQTVYERYESRTAAVPIDGPFTVAQRLPGLVFLQEPDILTLMVVSEANFQEYFRPKDDRVGLIRCHTDGCSFVTRSLAVFDGHLKTAHLGHTKQG